MASDIKGRSGAAGTAHGAKVTNDHGVAAEAAGTNILPAASADNRPHSLDVQVCPGRPLHWLVVIDHHEAFPIRREKLRRWRRVRNVARYHLGVDLPEAEPEGWRELVAAALAKVGAP